MSSINMSQTSDLKKSSVRDPIKRLTQKRIVLVPMALPLTGITPSYIRREVKENFLWVNDRRNGEGGCEIGGHLDRNFS